MVSSVLAQAILNQKAPDLVGSFREGQEISRQGKVRELSGEALKGSEGALEELSGIDPEIALSLGEAIRAKSAKDINDYIRDAKIGLNQLNNNDIQGAKSFAYQRLAAIKQRGGDTTQTQEYISLLESGDIESARQTLQGLVGSIDLAKDSAATQDFKFKTQGLSEEDAIKAKRISLGLDPRAGISAQERIAESQETTQSVADSQATIKGAGTKAQELAKVDVKVGTAERVGAAEARINELATTGTLDAKDKNMLKRTSGARVRNLEKAKGFKKALESGLRSSGVGRQAALFAPVGVWTDQGSFDEIFNSFAEVAAREKLKASGEIRPTDADVQGMKAAIFGVGRSEEANIQLLNDFIEEQEAMEAQIQRPTESVATPKVTAPQVLRFDAQGNLIQ